MADNLGPCLSPGKPAPPFLGVGYEWDRLCPQPEPQGPPSLACPSVTVAQGCNSTLASDSGTRRALFPWAQGAPPSPVLGGQVTGQPGPKIKDKTHAVMEGERNYVSGGISYLQMDLEFALRSSQP